MIEVNKWYRSKDYYSEEEGFIFIISIGDDIKFYSFTFNLTDGEPYDYTTVNISKEEFKFYYDFENTVLNEISERKVLSLCFEEDKWFTIMMDIAKRNIIIME